MFEDLEVANKEYEDLKVKYDELVVAKNGADEKIKTYEEGNKNYELFEQITNNSQPAQSKQDGKQDDEDNEVSFSDIIDKIF